MHHVLLVEDEPLVMAAASALLKSVGYSVSAAASYGEAMAILESDPLISLVITDVCLDTHEEGLDLAFAASRLRPSVRVVILSGKSRPALAECPRNAIFLEKPYDPRLLLAAAEAAVGQPAI